MILAQNYTPDVYYKQSRDFQFIGRLFDIVLNSVKTNTDLVYNMPYNDNFNDALIELLATTLGFQSKHNYNVNQLKAICAIFTLILRQKGNSTSIIDTMKALFNAEGVTEPINFSVEDNKININVPQELSSATSNRLNIIIPSELRDLNLLKDILSYILPFGITVTITKGTQLGANIGTNIKVNDDVFGALVKDYEVSQVTNRYKTINKHAPDEPDESKTRAVGVGTIGNVTVVRPKDKENKS